MSQTPSTPNQRNILAYILMGLLGTLLLIIAYFVAKDGFWYYLCKETGFALIVALFLIVTIERFTRERHEAAAQATMDEINKNLFYSIFKRYIPEKVFEEVENSVMESNVYRTEHELNYTIEARGQDQVSCIAQTSYLLTSVIDAPCDHNIVISLEMPIDGSNKEDCYIENLKIGALELTRDKLEPYVKRSPDHVILNYPHRLEGRANVRISTKSHLVKQTTDVEVWASRIPSDGLELTVSTPDRSLIVCAHANHSQKLDTIIDNGSTKKWTLKYGIFPYQSIMFWWKPKPTSAQAQQSAEPGCVPKAAETQASQVQAAELHASQGQALEAQAAAPRGTL